MSLFGARVAGGRSAALLKIIRRMLPGWVQIAIAVKDTDFLIGDIGICVKGDVAEIGFSAAPDVQNKGYATEACRAVIELLFEMETLQRIEAVVDARNDAAIALLKRLGMTLDHTEEAEFKGSMCVERHFVLDRSSA